MNIMHVELGYTRIKRRKIEGLCKNISNLIDRQHMKEFNETILNLLSGNMAIYVYLFGSFVKGWILGNMDGRIIVIVD